MNKRIQFLILSVCTFSNSLVFSQTTIDIIHNSMRSGDAVMMYKIKTANIWDLSSSEKCGKALYERYEDFKADTITGLLRGTRNYKVFCSDTLLYVGLENPQNLETMYLPETMCIFPMALGDNYCGFFAGHITYCDKLSLHKYGSYSFQADSLGSLILQDGNALNDALQISRRRLYMYEQIDSCELTNMPQYNEDKILSKLKESREVYTEIEREIYVNGYRYPIVRDLVLYDPNGEICKQETLYSPPEEQEHLFLDEPNLEARRERNDDDNSTSLDDNEDVFSFVNKQSDNQEVVFDYESYSAAYPHDGAIQCRLLLSDNRGVVYRTRSFTLESSTIQEVSISYSGLRRGQYVLSVVINDHIYTNNFIVE